MYEVRDNDRVVELTGLARPSAGAPLPVLVANEGSAVIAYLGDDDAYALVRFDGCLAHYMGWPNDEVLFAHPLAGRGLEPYAVQEVVESSWIRQLEHLNAAHDQHDARPFDRLRHILITFHDSTFECVAETFAVASYAGPPEGLVKALVDLLKEDR
jgi:hypothetical protein